jgi:hypothetical protein
MNAWAIFTGVALIFAFGSWTGCDFAKWNHCGQSKYHRTDNGRIVCQKLVDVSGDPR